MRIPIPDAIAVLTGLNTMEEPDCEDELRQPYDSCKEALVMSSPARAEGAESHRAHPKDDDARRARPDGNQTQEILRGLVIAYLGLCQRSFVRKLLQRAERHRGISVEQWRAAVLASWQVVSTRIF
eukprot:TRINITY_DN32386_c0_g1_i1.p2 TRINITY_DN32386_c0_g1~~TRINITY_DN32386_c0_g1_i1.p2  ORF type:complete len:126 (-),score=17.89 TRINITY_DN32386_c0_g1_i1:314-691(-)